MLGGAPASAAPATACVISDPRLDELSGLAATPTGYVGLNDGKFGTSVLRLFVLDRACNVTRVITDRGFDPLDPEDLARTADGTLWIADIGDNNRERATVAVDRLPPGASRGTTYRLTYPDGAQDAEALLIQPDGRAVIVTKALSGVAAIFVSARPLTGPPATLPLRAAGTVSCSGTGTTGGPDVGSFATVLVTGAALAPGGRQVVLRTYTDAYEWDVRGGDVTGALTGGPPRRTALPGEPQGESISFTADGTAYLTVSEGLGQPIRRWTPAPRPLPPTPSAAARARPRATKSPGLSPLVIGSAGGLGVALLLAGLVGAVRGRARRRQSHGAGRR